MNKYTKIAVYDEFDWECPECHHINHEYITEDGPSLEVVCKTCDSWIDLEWASRNRKEGVTP